MGDDSDRGDVQARAERDRARRRHAEPRGEHRGRIHLSQPARRLLPGQTSSTKSFAYGTNSALPNKSMEPSKRPGLHLTLENAIAIAVLTVMTGAPARRDRSGGSSSAGHLWLDRHRPEPDPLDHPPRRGAGRAFRAAARALDAQVPPDPHRSDRSRSSPRWSRSPSARHSSTPASTSSRSSVSSATSSPGTSRSGSSCRSSR